MLCRTDIWYIGKIGKCKAIDEVRSGLWGHLEAKTASKNSLEKIRMLSQSSSVNEFQEVILIFCQRAKRAKFPKESDQYPCDVSHLSKLSPKQEISPLRMARPQVS